MLVKKFEAKTMKQAVELVKLELGPEAIILGVKENDNGFGLMGETSIEVTAAIPESKYYQKKAAEKKLSTRARTTYQQTSARKQKEFIERANQVAQMAAQAANPQTSQMMSSNGVPADHHLQPQTAPPAAQRKSLTKRQYIDIEDEEMQAEASAYQSAAPTYTASAAATRAPLIKNAPAMKEQLDADFTEDEEILRLKGELSELKSLLSTFKSVPQTLSGSEFKAHPGAEDGISYELSFAYEKLMQSGLNKNFVVNSLKKLAKDLTAEQRRKKPYVEGWIIKQLMNRTMVSNAPTAGRYHVFLGPTGQGKTSTIVKFASHLIKKEKKKVAILSGDSVKVGAHDQLKIYSQILNIPFGVIDGDVDWAALDKQLEKIDVILIDSPGVNLKGAGDIDLVRRLIPKDIMQVKRLHFVQSIMARDQDAFDIIDRFKLFDIDDIIFTRLDEAVQFGSLLNFVEKFEIPIHSLGTSSDVPGGFEFASKERVVDLIFGVSKVGKEGGRQ